MQKNKREREEIASKYNKELENLKLMHSQELYILKLKDKKV